jgi:uncharacterized membrane protein
MRSTAQINGHPIHPMLIPYPFALLSSALVFDFGARQRGRAAWSQTASHLTSAGLASALVAAVPGIIDYFGSIPPRTRARRSATTHALCNVSALVCFAFASAQRGQDRRLPDRALALEALGTGLLSIGGWLGGELVYHEHVAVADRPVRLRLDRHTSSQLGRTDSPAL